MTATDLAVVLPGILGSTLGQDGHLVWAPSAGSALRAIGTFGASITRLELPAGIGDDHPHDGVEPVALMPDLHVLPGIWTPVKGYDKLLARLRSLGYREPDGPGAPPGNLLPGPLRLAAVVPLQRPRLGSIIEPALERWRAQGGPYADAQVVFVCHSMGGLIARWYIEKCGGAEITRKLITLGTPYRGAARALDQLVNGAHHGLGPFGLNLTGFARSMPSLHQLLPEYACLEHEDDLARTTDVTLPELDTGMVADAMRFHTDLRDAEAARPGQPASHPRHRGHPPDHSHHSPARQRQRSNCSTPIKARTCTGTPPFPSSPPAEPTSAWTATHCAASPTSTATCNATRPPSTRSKASSPPHPSSSKPPSPSACEWMHQSSPWPVKPSRSGSHRTSPPATLSASLSSTKPDRSATHASSGHLRKP